MEKAATTIDPVESAEKRFPASDARGKALFFFWRPSTKKEFDVSDKVRVFKSWSTGVSE
jgi:hypothetical protein